MRAEREAGGREGAAMAELIICEFTRETFKNYR